MSDTLDRALEQSLEMLRQGRTVEDCLARFPQEAAELEPILATVALVRDDFAAPVPLLARARLRSTVMAEWDRRAASSRRWWHIPWNASRFAMSAAAAVIVLAFVGGTATYASAEALPGDLLYPVKKTREDVQLALARSPEAKVEVLDRLLDERAEEVRVLSRAGRVDGMAVAADRMQRQAQRLASLAEDVGAVQAATPTPEAVFRDNAAFPSVESTPTPVPPSTNDDARKPVRDKVERVLEKHVAKLEALADEVAPETPSGDRKQPTEAVGRTLESVSKTLKGSRDDKRPGGREDVRKATPAAGDRDRDAKDDEAGRSTGTPTKEPDLRTDGPPPTPTSRRDDEDRDVRPTDGEDTEDTKERDQHGPAVTPPTPVAGPELPVQVTPAATPPIGGDLPLTPTVTPLPSLTPAVDTPPESDGPEDGDKPPDDLLGVPLPKLDDPRPTATPDGEGDDRGPGSSDGHEKAKPEDRDLDAPPVGRPIATPAPIGEGRDALPLLTTVPPQGQSPAGRRGGPPDEVTPAKDDRAPHEKDGPSSKQETPPLTLPAPEPRGEADES